MKFESQIFDEPELEFGDGHSHADPRLGLTEAGPLQAPLGDKVRVGVVGDAKSVESTQRFLKKAADGFESDSATHPNLHPNFPGLRNRNPFRCEFDVAQSATRALSKAQIEKIIKERDHAKAVEVAVEAILAELQSLDDSGERPDVAIVALPVALIERVWNARTDEDGTTEKEDAGGSDAPNFRGLLKARAMPLNFPIQIVWEDVVDESAKIPRKVKESVERKIQDEAGRTWNLLTTLYYKGTGRIRRIRAAALSAGWQASIPRPVRDSGRPAGRAHHTGM
ncbi:hypothetical protein [Enterovirga sp.]|uniref:hypothetical protein n=1 Tax=Enterovirga sp. TaxID=2026350 RepID=UPI002B613632|nr:hypothetical protein [Enterovirga sp.]HMO31255.1 hypothetical protein [Enterovirga sp.]